MPRPFALLVESPCAAPSTQTAMGVTFTEARAYETEIDAPIHKRLLKAERRAMRQHSCPAGPVLVPVA